MLSPQGIKVDDFYFLMSEPGVEDAVCGGWPEGEGPALTHGAAKNGDEAMLLYATQKIALGVFEWLDSFVIYWRGEAW
ncbi:hypothetical protein GCM10010869_25330 [Mesorhizobium tianshanense]|uniref:Uncharacterized protein n=1 Tax=Mesorhizobium tianshanense TaxID=39844 RepID=A0A562MIE1_9HYPH|nr:hypothetical protein IQ26_07073 [Mesorhizobium tianshanense]GLS36942.1 hypothetical protein GCM10010869_25330 [Mesorhizobium tianshanense]